MALRYLYSIFICAHLGNSQNTLSDADTTNFTPTRHPEVPKAFCYSNISTEQVIQEYLPACLSCKGRCGETTNISQGTNTGSGCSCDSHCMVYTDCCYDFVTNCPKEASVKYLEGPKDKLVQCRTFKEKAPGHEKYLLYDYCERDPEACKTSNESPSLFVPVYDPDRKIHFTNFACALCNQAKRLVPWNTSMTCEKVHKRKNISTTITKDEFSNIWKDCSVKVMPTEDMSKPRDCIDPDRKSRTCSESCNNTEFQRLCMSGHLSYVSYPYKFKWFLNFFCVVCSGEIYLEKPKISCSIRTFGELRPPIRGDFSFQLLFDVDLSRGLTVGEDESIHCSDGEVWISEEQKCRSIAALKKTTNLTMSLVTFVVRVGNSIQRSEYLENLTSGLLSVLKQNPEIQIQLFSESLLGIQFNISNNTNVSYEDVVDKIKKTIVLENIDILYNSFERNGSLICASSPAVVYLLHEYNFFDANHVKIIQTNKILPFSKIMFAANFSLLSCNSPKVQGLDSFSLVTIIFTSLSILALTIRLFLHCLLKDGGPARLQVCLVVALLMGMLTFLLHPFFYFSAPLCYFIAVLVHWSFLAAFSWMAVTGYDILYMLKASSSFKRAGAGNKRFLLYSFYAWGLPTAVVVLAISLDHSGLDKKWQPQYANPRCWISSRLGLLAYFVIPVAIQMLLNILSFVVSSIYMCRTKTPSSSQKQENQRLWLHFRLFILMGITWVFGFLAGPFNIATLWYIFIILNASQGVFLLVVYMMTKRTQQKLSSTLSEWTTTSTASATATTTL